MQNQATPHTEDFNGTNLMTSSTNTNPQDHQAPACNAPRTPNTASLVPTPFSNRRLEGFLDLMKRNRLTARQAARLQSFCRAQPEFRVLPDNVQEPHPWQAEMLDIYSSIPNSNGVDNRPVFSDKKFSLLLRDLHRYKGNSPQLACFDEVAAIFMPAPAEKAPPPKSIAGVVLDEPLFPDDLNALIPAIIRVHDWLHARERAVTGTSATGCPCGGTCGHNCGAPNAAQKGGEDNQRPASCSSDQDDHPGQPQEARNAVPPRGACNAEDRSQGYQQPRPRHRRPARQQGGMPSQPTTGGQA